jgi:hypothetical protein
METHEDAKDTARVAVTVHKARQYVLLAVMCQQVVCQ